MHVQQQQNCLHKKLHTHIEINFNEACKKVFYFCFSVYGKKIGIMIFWVGGKNYIVKNKDCMMIH